MKYSGLLRSLILIWFGHMNAMQIPNELKLDVFNMTDKIVAAYDQSEKYHDIFPNSAYRSLLWKQIITAHSRFVRQQVYTHCFLSSSVVAIRLCNYVCAP